MSNTKACSLTEDEIVAAINYYMCGSGHELNYRIERINYLNKRLKAFKEVEYKPDPQTVADTKQYEEELKQEAKSW